VPHTTALPLESNISTPVGSSYVGKINRLQRQIVPKIYLERFLFAPNLASSAPNLLGALGIPFYPKPVAKFLHIVNLPEYL
jgi:hypothetical protein